ncbi:MAG: PilZ domain-containing protein, partial [Candidatus Binatia bacterium]
MAADRRLSQRVSAETGNYASYRGGPGKIRDLSQEGVFIEDQDPLSVGTSSEFNLHLGNESVPVRGVVRSSIPEVGLGVQFVQVSPQARENLERYVNTLAQFPGEAGKQPENGRRVWVEIDKLKQQLDRERKGVAGLARRWGAVVALLVAIVAVPRGFVDLKHLVFGRPDTLLVQSNNVRLFYEPGERMVGVGFSFTLINEGQKDDVIGEPRVNLARAALPLPQKWVLPISKLDCSTLGAPTP